MEWCDDTRRTSVGGGRGITMGGGRCSQMRNGIHTGHDRISNRSNQISTINIERQRHREQDRPYEQDESDAPSTRR